MRGIRGRYLRQGRPLLLVVGIRPGRQEYAAKAVFVGPSGKVLIKILNEEWKHGVYLMNAIPSSRGTMDDWYQETLEEAKGVSPDYVLALGAEARLWAVRATKEIPVRKTIFLTNPASALEGHMPIQRWVEIARSALRTMTVERVGITVRPINNVVALDTECKGHPCAGFTIAAATDGERHLVTEDPKELQRFIQGRHVVAHNAVYDLIALRARGVEVDGEVDCTMTMKGILDPEGSRDLDVLAGLEFRVLLGDPPYTEWKRGKVDDQTMGGFCLNHAKACLGLYERYRSAVKAYQVYMQLYRPLLPILARMHKLRVDVEGLQRYKESLLLEEKQVQAALEKCALINWNSTRQVAAYFTERGVELPLTEAGQPSVSERVLEQLDMEEAKLLLKRRHILKLLSTYVDPLLEKGELWTTYDPVGARTGRMSSKNMNVQNIPNGIRRFILPPEGCLWLEADYKAAEYAVAAYWSQDPFMLNALKSGDVHTYTARLLIGRDPTPEERRDVKAITFGLLYLASETTVEEYTTRLGGSPERAQEMYKLWWELHSGYREKVNWLWNQMKLYGIYQGIRRRYKCSSSYITTHDLRLAVNQIIQGGASDITSEALLKVSSEFTPLTVVHDSLSVAVPMDMDPKQAEARIREVMAECSRGYIDAETKVGRTWYDPEYAQSVAA